MPRPGGPGRPGEEGRVPAAGPGQAVGEGGRGVPAAALPRTQVVIVVESGGAEIRAATHPCSPPPCQAAAPPTWARRWVPRGGLSGPREGGGGGWLEWNKLSEKRGPGGRLHLKAGEVSAGLSHHRVARSSRSGGRCSLSGRRGCGARRAEGRGTPWVRVGDGAGTPAGWPPGASRHPGAGLEVIGNLGAAFAHLLQVDRPGRAPCPPPLGPLLAFDLPF